MDFASSMLPAELADEVKSRLRPAIRRCIGKVVGDFYRRIMRRILFDSPCLLWFGYGTPDTREPKRADVSSYLLTTPAHKLPQAGAAIKRMYAVELQSCVDNAGAICATLFLPFIALCTDWPADTQEVEGVMSLIRNVVLRRSNQVELDLLDADVGNSKDLSVATRAAKKLKYSDLEPIINDAVEDSLEHVSAIEDYATTAST